MKKIRPLIQALSLAVFLALLLAVADWGYSGAWADLFLRMDPSLVGFSALAGRIWLAAFWPALLVLASAFFLGRAFCAYLCPLGATLDGAKAILKPRAKAGGEGPGPLWLKYLLLAALAGAALFGVGLVFWLSPLALATRFYGLLIHPLFALGAQGGLDLLRPLAQATDMTSLAMAQIKPPHFATQIFTLLFFAGLFALLWLRPRAWCRWLCPLGAMLSLCSRRSLIRRRVSSDCSQCGLCARTCPMGAIPADAPELTRSGECQLCLSCQAICPENAISFGSAGAKKSKAGARETGPGSGFLARRNFLKAGAAGAGLAAVGLAGLDSPLNITVAGAAYASGPLRPPGALPEADFMARCVRCGECMAACPSNGLQPLWLGSGWLGLFSPALTPRQGYCDSNCNRCGQVCPTGAIRPLELVERRWARSGMAVIDRARCLAWEQQKSCMVCDEVCPYKAINFERQAGAGNAVPHVQEDRCAGCGYCEHYCPVAGTPAITVSPAGALRLKSGSYMAHGRSLGLNISTKKAASPEALPQDGPAPGFTQ